MNQIHAIILVKVLQHNIKQYFLLVCQSELPGTKRLIVLAIGEFLGVEICAESDQEGADDNE
jgi:hypothetical protein